jgi:hypothetical protein
MERDERRRAVVRFWQLRDGLESRRRARAPRIATAPPADLANGAAPAAADGFAPSQPSH